MKKNEILVKSQCGYSWIFLTLGFYVKSILVRFRGSGSDKGNVTQYENYIIFLSLRFYVKLKLTDSAESSNLGSNI